MEDTLHSQLDLEDLGPEVKSYIYQVLTEFEPYTTEDTMVMVIAKDPLKIRSSDVIVGEIPKSRKKLAKMYRLCIRISEDGEKLEAEGIDADIFVALRKASDSLLKTLAAIHDTMVDSKERNQQIREALDTSSDIIH